MVGPVRGTGKTTAHTAGKACVASRTNHKAAALRRRHQRTTARYVLSAAL
ncbi:hypothetical protein XHC_1069 [Xanthomonas hortorum pv. carotae str. M081]|nr:hypothetical protein XHC_1069 [Xanthomonas hortorum pv. carotae str. M081]